MKLIDVMHCRLREVTEDKKPVSVCQMEASSSGDTGMNPVFRLAVQNGIQSLTASDCSKQRKRKRQVAQVNGIVDDVDDAEKKNDCNIETGEENIRRKRRKKLTLSEQSDSVVSESQERQGEFVVESTDAAAGSDPKSVSENEVEIWIPNKKYKGPLRDAYAKLARGGSRKIKCPSSKDDSTPFMTFVPVEQTPAALVRRRNKLSHSEPKQLHKSVSFMFISILLGRSVGLNDL